MRCDRGNCTEPATHLVYIWFPDEPDEIWRVCRAHDRELKRTFVARRTPKPPGPAPLQDDLSGVYCKQCDLFLGDSSVLAAVSRKPCPDCGSTERLVRIAAAETVTAYSNVRLRSRQPGKGGWLKEAKDGDDFTRDLAAWGQRTLEKDREHNLYRELIKLYDGSWLDSTAMLDNHHD
jgi:hypothetical protein